MPRIGPVSLRAFEHFLIEMGCVSKRQKGSHKIYHRPGLARPIVLPIHGKELPAPYVRSALKGLGVSEDEFLRRIGGN